MMRIEVENSTVSHALHSESMGGKMNQIDIKAKNTLNFLFPLFDQITKLTAMPKIISFIVALFFYLQIIFSATYPYTDFYRTESSLHSAEIVQKETLIFWFLNHDVSMKHATISLVITLAIFIICVVWFLFIGLFYHYRRRYIKWTLFPTRFLIEIVSPILLHPSSAAAGAILMNLIHDSKQVEKWILLALGILVYIGFYVSFVVGYSLMCSSSILTTTYYSTYEPKYMRILSVTSSLTVFLSFLFESFNYWVMNILQAIHFIIFVYLFVSVFRMHYHKVAGSVLAFSTILTSLVLDSMMFVFNLITSPSSIIPIIASYALFLLCILIGYFVINAIFKKTSKKLVYPNQDDEDEANITNDDQVKLFKELHIDTNSKNALMYMRVGLAAMSKPFTDFSLAKFIITTYQDDVDVLCPTIQVLSFFPSQQQLLNGCFLLVLRKSKLNLYQRFTLFQAYHVKIMRQSSTPLEASDRLLHLRIQSRDCEFSISSFWYAKISPQIGLFETINSITEKADGLWQEGIRDYPNNSEFYEDYCRFLTECRTDFKSAIIQKQKIDMIDNGTNFSTDYAFRRFVRNFPLYLKRKVLDTSGNAIVQASRLQNSSANMSMMSSSSSSNNNKSSQNSAFDIDFEQEMTQAKSLFSQSKLRMSLYNALKNSRLTHSKLMVITAFVTLIVSIAAFTTMNLLLKSWLTNRSLDSSNSNEISNTVFYINIANLHALYFYALMSDKFSMQGLMYLMTFRQVESDLVSYVAFGAAMWNDLISYLKLGGKSFLSFMNQLTSQASKGLDVYSMASIIFKEEVGYGVCLNSTQYINGVRSLKDTISDIYFDFMRLIPTAPAGIYNTDAYCEIPTNLGQMSKPFVELLTTLHNQQVSSYNDFNTQLKYTQIVVPIVVFVLQFVPFFIIAICFSNKMKKFAKLLIELDPKTKEKAKQPILISNTTDGEQYQSDHIEVGHRWVILLIGHTLLSIASFLLLFFFIYVAGDINQNFKMVNDWQILCSQRFILSIEATHMIFQIVFVKGQNTNVIASDIMKIEMNDILDLLKQANTRLLRGSDETESCEGFDSEFDALNSRESCNVDDATVKDTVHDLYRCTSAAQSVSIFADMVLTALLKVESFNGVMNDPLLVNLFHCANAHLYYRLMRCNDRLLEIIQENYDGFSQDADIFLIFGIILGIILLIFQIFASSYSHKLYHVGLSLVKRIPPTLFVANKNLLNFVLNLHSQQQSTIKCTSHGVIMHSTNGMIGVNKEGSIEMVNPALTTILGYTPDQLLGQPITEIFGQEEGEKVTGQMIAMANGQSSLINEDHYLCLADNTNEVPCHIYIIGIKGKLANEVESYAFLLQDETALIEQQTQAEQAKAQSEKLLFQILPRSIVTRLNAGEHDISFSVPSATIIFTDIIRWSDYSSNLTPAEVMGNLSQIFAAFDEAAKQYPLITKIKLIGDIYMAAAGLFISESDNTPPQQHAIETIRFGLNCINALEVMNEKLDANLMLRIGVNSGGPLFAGVLGKDKPVFDIIGDPINVAARLQTTDLPNKIQIPQSTYNLIVGSNEFYIEQRGEVFLKGKGKTMAYFVSSFDNAFSAGSEEIPMQH